MRVSCIKSLGGSLAYLAPVKVSKVPATLHEQHITTKGVQWRVQIVPVMDPPFTTPALLIATFSNDLDSGCSVSFVPAFVFACCVAPAHIFSGAEAEGCSEYGFFPDYHLFTLRIIGRDFAMWVPER